jgi:hypothetical protein
VSIGAGRQVPRRHDRSKPATRYAGYRGMDNMHPPRATPSRVNALCGTPQNNVVPRYPLGHVPVRQRSSHVESYMATEPDRSWQSRGPTSKRRELQSMRDNVPIPRAPKGDRASQ